MKKNLTLILFLLYISCSKDSPVETSIKFSITFSSGSGGSVSSSGGSYETGTSVSVTATPDSEYVFVDWSNGSTQNPLSVTATSNQTLTANFEKRKYSLTMTVIGEGTVSEEIISAGKTTTEYTSGSVIRLTANPSDGWGFSGWSGTVSSTENPIEINVTESKTITANFEELEELCELDYTSLFNGVNKNTSHYQPMNIPFVDYAGALNIDLPPYSPFVLHTQFGNFNGNNEPDYIIAASGGTSWETTEPGELTVVIDGLVSYSIPNIQTFTRKISIYDINSDGIDDVVLFGHGPEFGDPWPGDKNVVIYMSPGGYEIVEVGNISGFHHSGAVGVLSGNTPSILELDMHAFQKRPDGFVKILTYQSDNNWVEEDTNIPTHHIARSGQSEFYDFDGDGVLDIILGGQEWEESWMSNSLHPVQWRNHILRGLGGGQFDIDNPILLPIIPDWGKITDFDIYDIDRDGSVEIIITRTTGRDGIDQNMPIDNIFYDGYMVQILKGNANSWNEWKRLEQPEIMTTGNLHHPWFKSIVYDVNGDCMLDIVPESDKLNAQSFTNFNVIRGLYYEQQQNGEFEIKYKQ